MNAPQIITAEQIPALEPLHVIDSLRTAFLGLARGRVLQPAQAQLPLDGGGDIIAYPALDLDAGIYALKLSPYIARAEGALVTAWTLLFDVMTGRPVALIDSKGLTTLRTAAATALAVDLLADADAKTISVVGSGAAALSHIDYLRAVRPNARLRMHVRRMRTFELPGVEIVEGVDDAADADVIALCTSASASVIDASRARVGAVITSISTNAPSAHEIAPELLPQLEVYCDFRGSAHAVPDFVLAQSAGWASEEIRGDLPELVSGTATRPSGKKAIYFRSIGLGIEDAAIAAVVTRALTAT